MAPPTSALRSGPPRGGGRTSRGAITKRRFNATKIDRDGDVSMDAPAKESGAHSRGGRGGRGRSVPRTTARGSGSSQRLAEKLTRYGRGKVGEASKEHFHNNQVLKVLGLRESKAASNADGGLKTLLEFIERKASKDGHHVTIIKSVMEGDFVWIRVDKEVAPLILKLNGFTCAGATLEITETTEPMPMGRNGRKKTSEEAKETRAQLRTVLESRYNADLKLLDFSALGADPILAAMGTFTQQNLAEKAFKALLIVASAHYGRVSNNKREVQAVSLANNSIAGVEQLVLLSECFPALQRLDLSGNNIATLASISKIKFRFRDLAELHLVGNPVVLQEEDLVQAILPWFPSLQNLNGTVVRTAEEAAQARSTLAPQPIPEVASNVQDGNVGPFLQTFFPLFDNDRARLVAELYDDDSWFSLAVMLNSGQSLPFKSYAKYTRNIQKLGGRGAHLGSAARNPASMQRLFTGGPLIAELWKVLPATRHPAIDEPGQYIVDAFTFPHLADPSGVGSVNGLKIHIQGRYEESDMESNTVGMRMFSRTFILGPAKPGSQVAYRVISDQLTLHHWSPIKRETQSQTVAVVPAPEATHPTQLSDEMKQAMVAELGRRTGMNAHYCHLCLSGAPNWNFNNALESYEGLKDSLPQEAWVQ